MFDKIIKKIDTIIVVFAFVALAISLYLVYTLNVRYTQKETVQSLNNILMFTKNMLEDEQQRALSLSLLLSEDKMLLKNYESDRRKKVFEIINEKIQRLKALQGYTFEVQIHDKDLNTYLRSWDYNIKDIPLASFREGLVLAKKSQKPIVSIEVGKRLNIKAISPILNNNKFLGSIEVIEGFGHLRKKLSQQGYNFLILLDRKYLSIATSLKNHLIVAKQYVIVNDIYDKASYDRLQNINFKELGNYGYFSSLGYAFGYFEIKNYHDEKLGYCIVAKKQDIVLPSLHQESVPLDCNRTGVRIR